MVGDYSFGGHRQNFNILIVGAGPAGIATALFLAKKGIPCTLIEKDTFPRDKICGDGLTPWVVTMLHKLDMGLVEELRNSEHAMGWSGARVMAPNHAILEIRDFYHKRPGEPPGYTIRRKEFDQILINKVKSTSGIELHQGITVKDAVFNEEFGVTLKTNQDGLEFHGDLVVWADGANSVFSKKRGGMPLEHDNWITGIKTYYDGLYPDYMDDTPGDYQNNLLEMYILKGIIPGYLWIFPLAHGEANVGLGMQTDKLKQKRVNLRALLDEIIESTPELKSRFSEAKRTAPIQAWPIPIGVQKRSLSGDRYIIVGDAASLGDPATGEGVGNALNSGFHAAEHIADCLVSERFDATFNQQFDKRVYDKLWSDLRWSKLGLWLVVRPRLLSWIAAKANRNPGFEKTFVDLITDPEADKKFRQPATWFRLLFG